MPLNVGEISVALEIVLWLDVLMLGFDIGIEALFEGWHAKILNNWAGQNIRQWVFLFGQLGIQKFLSILGHEKSPDSKIPTFGVAVTTNRWRI